MTYVSLSQRVLLSKAFGKGQILILCLFLKKVSNLNRHLLFTTAVQHRVYNDTDTQWFHF